MSIISIPKSSRVIASSPRICSGSLFIWLFLLPVGAYAACEASLPLPAAYPDATSQTIAKMMRVSGTPTSACRFEADAPVYKVLAFYRRQFGIARVENRLNDIWIIARPNGDHWQTVQLRGNTRRTQALVSSADFKRGLAALNQPIGQPLPGGSKVISDIETEDPPGKQARVLAIQNTNSIEANLEFLTASLRERGYQVDRTLKAGTSNDDGASVWLSAPGKDAVIVATRQRNGQTGVVMNFVQTSQGMSR